MVVAISILFVVVVEGREEKREERGNGRKGGSSWGKGVVGRCMGVVNRVTRKEGSVSGDEERR